MPSWLTVEYFNFSLINYMLYFLRTEMHMIDGVNFTYANYNPTLPKLQLSLNAARHHLCYKWGHLSIFVRDSEVPTQKHLGFRETCRYASDSKSNQTCLLLHSSDIISHDRKFKRLGLFLKQQNFFCYRSIFPLFLQLFFHWHITVSAEKRRCFLAFGKIERIE